MDFSGAIQLIEKSKHIGLVLPNNPNHDVLASAEVLAQFLSSRNIYVGIITPHNIAALHREEQGSSKNFVTKDTIPSTETAQHAIQFPSLASLPPLTKECIISVDISAAPISQLRYETTDKQVNIILSPSSNSILQDHVSFREGATQCDCIITLAVHDIEEVDTVQCDIDPSMFSETSIIAIDISSTHKQYGEVNLTDASLPSLAELIYRFLAAFPAYTLPSQSATLLLSGVLHCTDGFTVLTNASTLLSTHELIQHGADYETAHAMSRTQIPVSLMSLIGRSLARSKIDEQKQILWSSITRDDFLATGRTPSDAPDVLTYIKKEFLRQSVHILLWQDPITQKIYVRMAADIILLKTLRDTIDAELEDTHARLSETYHSFPHAEQSITALLDNVL